MNIDTGTKQKRCVYCGRFFIPDRRVRLQKSCARSECRKKRKRESQARWLEKYPDYFKNHYSDNIKKWRDSHPDYQKQWRTKKRREMKDAMVVLRPIRTLRIVIPDKFIKGEKKDKIILTTRCQCGYYATGQGMQDERRDRYPDSS